MEKEGAVKAIQDRLRSIEAGFADCGIAVMTGKQNAELHTSLQLQQIHQNRVTSLFISIAHLKDDCKRWGKTAGVSAKQVDDFCASSPAIALVIKVADTAKHGLGGHSKNNSLLGYQIVLHKQSGSKPQPFDPIVDLFWLVVDTDGEPQQSNLLLSEAIHKWLIFLNASGLDVNEWIEQWKPLDLPKGWSRYKGLLPEKLLKMMRQEAHARKRSF